MTPDKNRVRCSRCGQIHNNNIVVTTSVGTYCYWCLLELSDEINSVIEDLESETINIKVV